MAVNAFPRVLDGYGTTISTLEDCEEETCSAKLTNLVAGEGEKEDEDGDVVKGGAMEDESAVSTFDFLISIEVCEEEGGDDDGEDFDDDDGGGGGGDDGLTSRNSASI